MRRTFTTALLLAAGVACTEDPSGVPPGELAADDTGIVDDDDLDDTGGDDSVRAQFGTQVGSEGVWGCLIEDTAIVDDTSETIDALGASPDQLIAAHTGSFGGELTTAAGNATAVADLTSSGAVRLVTVEGADSCEDYLQVDATLAVATGDLLSGDAEAKLAIRSSEARLYVDVDWTTLDSTMEPATFDASEQATVRVTGLTDFGPTGGTLPLEWTGCVGATCTTEDLGLLLLGR